MTTGTQQRRKERIDRGIKVRTEGIYALMSWRELGYLIMPRFVIIVSGEGAVLACGELAPLGASVAEVRSLVVREDARGGGLGHVLVDELRRRARAGRYRTLCAFTHDPRFFVRFGFSIVPHTWLPEKVAADCWSCQHFRACAQYAVVDSRLGRTDLAMTPEYLS